MVRGCYEETGPVEFKLNAPTAWYWFRPVLDDGVRQDWTSPSCKGRRGGVCDAPLPRSTRTATMTSRLAPPTRGDAAEVVGLAPTDVNNACANGASGGHVTSASCHSTSIFSGGARDPFLSVSRAPQRARLSRIETRLILALVNNDTSWSFCFIRQ